MLKLEARAQNVDQLAKSAGLQKKLVQGGTFLFTTYSRIVDPRMPVTVYIEGDGHLSQGMLQAPNPTPREPMVLKLAMQDPRANILYIARPCQYTPMQYNPKCVPELWLNKRWSNEVVTAMDQAIIKITNQAQLNLIGFSGGGSIAVLIAARNPQVTSILTVAANLDLQTFKQRYNALITLDDLNPMDYVQKVKHIPQLHLAGLKDSRVPPYIIHNFVKKSNSPCVQQVTVPNTSHNSGWVEAWPRFLKMPIPCQKINNL